MNLAQLSHDIGAGEIDTVIVAFPDLQGRPVGKRMTGPFFFLYLAWPRKKRAISFSILSDS